MGADDAIHMLNGPNLNLLGEREPEIYGATTLPDIERDARKHAAGLGFELRCFQTNCEGALIDRVQEARKAAGIVINPGGLTHSSIALMDALAACLAPVIEVHLSNIQAREDFRARSYVSCVAAGVISGLGPLGYLFAIDAIALWRKDR